jgi:hypothetical protein
MIKNYSNIIYGISKKTDGQMILRYGSLALINRRRFFADKGIDIGNVVSANLVHGNRVGIVSAKEKGTDIADTDGLITSEKGICLSITISDCLPIFFYDHKREIIGLAHAGWRGVISKIAVSLVKRMNSEFYSNPEDIEVYVGPHLQKCHFEITKELLPEFVKYNGLVNYVDNRIFIDLAEIVKRDLIKENLLDDNIEISPVCTYCDASYFSYRRDKPEGPVSQIAYICLV